MLVTLKNILKIAEAKKCAIGSFNTPNLESLIGVLTAAEKAEMPVIIMHAECHEEFLPLDIMGPIMVDMAEKASVPVCVHLDHGTSLSYLKRALDMGFTSIMYDGSVLDYELNEANTCVAVDMASEYSASVEGEIGVMTRRETPYDTSDPDANQNADIYTRPDDAAKFVSATGIDALACAFGTAHGIYLKKPKLDFERLSEIRSAVSVPLVMHGGSGVSDEDYIEAISRGIRKINYYTYMSIAGAKGIHDNIGNIQFFHDVVKYGTAAIEQDVAKAINVFSMK